ncbi:MAG TPA: serine/threonine-protein kinase [Gemmatimonas sp.]|uniref:serine/threonine-protein kinase n=1 Tax=Gemmatimonas sp. TaxID=1962908 RepID=UPI002EDB204B
MIAPASVRALSFAADAARWQRLENLVDIALDAPAAEREAVVHAHCADDPALGEAALAWLRECGEDAAGVLEHPLEKSAVQAAWRDVLGERVTTEPESVPHGPGSSVGAWQLVREIGRGGMGVVYLAERSENDVVMRAALKLMRHADAMDAVGLRRFRDEQRILATLAHPAIARLVDVGIDGTIPWLAMEFIDGTPIDVWCKDRALSIEQRLVLFCEVADAVQHAHARLVVHRDLKPANILVSEAGHPTLLDFGIAKLLDAGGMQPADHLTRPGLQPMTPAYAAPEQKRGAASSTVSDVYALGVLLHELLTGTLPQDGVLASASARTQPDGARRARRLRGDLDTIIARAIDDEPSRRYPTAEALAADLRRHLRGLPVLARRDSVAYRLRKFAARHPVPLAAVALSLMLAGTFTVFTVVQSRQLREQATILRAQTETLRLERDKAVQVTQFLKDVLSNADPYKAGSGVPTLHDVLDRGTTDMEQRLHDRPEIRAQLYSAIAPAYFGLGDWTRAGELAAEAVRLRRPLVSGNSTITSAQEPPALELAAALIYLASVRLNQGLAVEAEQHARESLDIMRAERTTTTNDSLSALSALGAALQKQGRLREAGDVLASVLQMEYNKRPITPARLAQFERNLAHVRRDDGRIADATVLYAQAHAHHREAFGVDHPETANSAFNLGYAYFLSRRLEQALPLMESGLTTKRRLLGAGNQDVLGDQRTYARVLDSAGRPAEARRWREAADSVARLLAQR